MMHLTPLSSQAAKTAAGLAVLLLLSSCSSLHFFNSRHDMTEDSPLVEGHPLVLPPDYDLKPPRQSADYEASLPHPHMLMASKPSAPLPVQPVLPESTSAVVTPAATTAPALATATPVVASMNTATVSATPVVVSESSLGAPLSSEALQATVDREKAANEAENNGFFHKYFSWMIPSHGKK